VPGASTKPSESEASPPVSKAAHPRKPGLWRRLRALSAELRGFPVWVRRTEDGLLITAHLPGVRKDEVWVEVTEFAVIIDVEQRHDDSVHRAGRRVIPLPTGTEVEEAKAELKGGTLSIHLLIFRHHHCRRIMVEGVDDPLTGRVLEPESQ